MTLCEYSQYAMYTARPTRFLVPAFHCKPLHDPNQIESQAGMQLTLLSQIRILCTNRFDNWKGHIKIMDDHRGPIKLAKRYFIGGSKVEVGLELAGDIIYLRTMKNE